MKRWLWFLFGFTAFLSIAIHDTTRGQGPGTKSGDIGPGEQGAKLRIPGIDAPPAPSPMPMPTQGKDSSYKSLWNPTVNPMGGAGGLPFVPPTKKPIAQLPTMPTDVNKDIEITPSAGQWILFLKAYTGEEAPMLARALVMELRTNYNIKAAYIFNYGAEEKRLEYERVQKAYKKQAEDLAKSGLTGQYAVTRVHASKIDEQTGVLIGGYRDRDEALRALAQIRHLKAPDPQRFKLDIIFVGELERDKKGNVRPDLEMKDYVKDGRAYVNPFGKAFPARNPSIKGDQEDAQMSAQDLEVLRKINREEKFTLFECKGKYTLVVKQFNTQFKMGSDVKVPARWFDPLFGALQPEWKDNAAHNAHNMAEGFRKSGLPETFVLHTRFCSFVTVGGFESLEDRRLVALKEQLESRFRTDAYRQLEMLTPVVPMLVPH